MKTLLAIPGAILVSTILLTSPLSAKERQVSATENIETLSLTTDFSIRKHKRGHGKFTRSHRHKKVKSFRKRGFHTKRVKFHKRIKRHVHHR